MDHQGIFTAYFSVVAIVFSLAFRFIEGSRHLIFLFLLALFSIPIYYATIGEVWSPAAVAFTIITPLVPMLIVIDPLEIGLHGHDPYLYSMPALEQILSGDLQAAMIGGSYPMTYLLVGTIQGLLGLSLESVAKYTPLVAGIVPFTIFVFARRHLPEGDALIAAIITGSTRTLITFETKFVDEVLAVALVFVLIVLLDRQSKRENRLLIIITAVTAATHHATFAFFAVFVALRGLVPRILRMMNRSSGVIGRFLPRLVENELGNRSGIYLIVVIAFGIIIPMYSGGGAFLALVIRSVFQAFTGVTSSLSGGGISNTPANVFDLLSTSLLFSLVLLTVFVVWRVFRTPSEEWEISWVAFVGVLGIGYAVTLVAGRALPLDPIRFLIFIIPFLGAVALAKRDSSSKWTKHVVVLIAVCLIVPNLAAIPSHMLLTDVDYKPGAEEGHFTTRQWQASSWASDYANSPVYGHEGDLWVAEGNSFQNRAYAVCEGAIIAIRSPPLHPSEVANDRIYSNAGIHLERC